MDALITLEAMKCLALPMDTRHTVIIPLIATPIHIQVVNHTFQIIILFLMTIRPLAYTTAIQIRLGFFAVQDSSESLSYQSYKLVVILWMILMQAADRKFKRFFNFRALIERQFNVKFLKISFKNFAVCISSRENKSLAQGIAERWLTLNWR